MGSLCSAMALTTKLTALTAQLASVQEENDTIRGRYLELEEAWQGMIDENKAVHEKNVELRDTLEASQAQCKHRLRPRGQRLQFDRPAELRQRHTARRAAPCW